MNVARFSPDGQYVAGASCDSPLLRIYQVNSEKLDLLEFSCGEFHIHAINDIAWSPCSRYVATGGDDCVIVIWRLRYNESSKKTRLEPRRVLRGHVAAVTTLAFNKTGSMLASGSIDEKIIVWNVKGGTLFKLLNAHSLPIVSVDFSYDNKLLLSASHDGYLRVWSLVDGMAVRILTGAEKLTPICSAIFSPNSVYALVTYADGVTRLLDLANKEVIKVYGITSNSEEMEKQLQKEENLYMRELAFCHPNYILVGKPDGVAVYEIKSQKHICTVANVPALCVDVNEGLHAGLCAGPQGIKIFRLKFT